MTNIGNTPQKGNSQDIFYYCPSRARCPFCIIPSSLDEDNWCDICCHKVVEKSWRRTKISPKI